MWAWALFEDRSYVGFILLHTAFFNLLGNVRIHICRNSHAAVSQTFLYILYIIIGFQEQYGVGMP
ncbi:hypothetical protein A3842_02620 [Paenibacillus sp. P3E]|nr:hypothetical protein A3842_02620 [Paenibacillus sp. P3E]